MNNNKISGRSRFVFILLAPVIGHFVFMSPAYAYIDPGVGSIVFQGLLAGLITMLAFWRNLRLKIRNFFSSKSDESDPIVEDVNGNDKE